MKYNMVITFEDYEKAAKNGISKANVYQRVNGYGWSVERAITEPVKHCKGSQEGMVVIAECNGISRPTYFRRISRGMPPHEAATKPKGHTAFLEIAAEHGIKDVTFYQRIARGMTPYEAATKPARKYKKKIS
ncbi:MULTISPECIES: hypothetical protein [Bacillus]|uniref:hypothetical protein n=1 Tax=Bacillus TaxID=1386 RepID=UPI00036F6C0D|nr:MULTISPECIES: hypothetical protein [Bacillus]MED1436923.1 hypothetical protein [Bacillus mycoides]MED1473192.1 hypothetical protein [Bacillus pseudomycoides]PEP86125.1 hypothetical protein CN584_08700 [Bacillus pseudomycoides]